MKNNFSYVYNVMVLTIILIAILMVGVALWYDSEGGTTKNDTGIVISSFNDCVAAGYPVMESYPRQCVANEVTYIEDIGDQVNIGNTTQNINTAKLSEEAKNKIAIYTDQTCIVDEDCGPFPCNNGECLIKECTCSCSCPSSNCGNFDDEVPGYCQSVNR